MTDVVSLYPQPPTALAPDEFARALPDAPPVGLVCWQYMGLFFSSALVGMFQATTKGNGPFMFAVFSYLLGEESFKVASDAQLVSLFWSFKLFIGALSDCYPIFSYRRKSYMFLGWCVVVVCLIFAILCGQPQRGDVSWHYLLCFFGINFGFVVRCAIMQLLTCFVS
jgi:hypothetical protein